MKEFLRAFNLGVFEKDLSGEQKELVRNLLNIGAISAHKGKLYLNDGYVLGSTSRATARAICKASTTASRQISSSKTDI